MTKPSGGEKFHERLFMGMAAFYYFINVAPTVNMDATTMTIVQMTEKYFWNLLLTNSPIKVLSFVNFNK
jgi:hypothetical protein